MKILVLNLGSSSLKYKLFDAARDRVVSFGIIDKIDTAPEARCDGLKNLKISIKNHSDALSWLKQYILNKKVIQSESDIRTVAHRVVHGGEYFHEPVLVDKTVLKRIKDLFSLSPLHNPINYEGIVLSQKLFPRAQQIAVFDTSFYHTIKPRAYLYGIPYKYYKKYGIRQYGFHGISHQYIGSEVSKLMKKRTLRHISCHLGNGSSITAIKNGKAVDTTMGFTPLQGVIMGTRSGSIDPAIVPFLEEKEGMTPEQVDHLLNHESGILGVSQISSDVRDIYYFLKQGDKRAKLTLEMISYQITKFIGQMAAVMGGVDVISFTGGIGQNAFYIREMALEPLKYLGVTLDEKKNQKNATEISAKTSEVKVFVLETDEEGEMYGQVKSC